MTGIYLTLSTFKKFDRTSGFSVLNSTSRNDTDTKSCYFKTHLGNWVLPKKCGVLILLKINRDQQIHSPLFSRVPALQRSSIGSI